ncbi:hypothetical protein [Aminobacter carboxidus]|uniref:Uncharacterized protein n=1 Tax=Aminobacter carboxidus TaxID=376165 RepID=A0ABR9GWU8_9HYPH|nr:hypothetical protein [Aminobacter carboxidus]MBE1208158.1 hypothetical protein [Aminobacter carboxidus]
MNTPTRTPAHDRETGEIVQPGNLPASYQAGNQSLAVQLAMAELNQDVVTARSFPRSVSTVMRNITELVMLDEQTAKECVYAVPRDGKTIRGPSIRLAEIIASQWGNCHCASRVVHIDRIEKYVESEGIFHDLETGLKRTARTRKAIAKRDGGVYSLDMVMTAGNAAASIGMREAILKGVPKAVWRQAYEHAEKVIRGDVTTLAERRGDAMKALLGLGVTAERVFAAINVAGLEEIGLDELADLFTMYQGVKNGDTNVDEVFPSPKQKGDEPATLKGKLDKLAGDDVDKNKNAADAAKKSEAGSSPAASDKPGKAGPAATGQQPSSDSSPESDDGDLIADANRKGRAAYRKNMNRKANPFREGAERDAWLAGYNDEAAKDGDNSPEPGSED